ncbi:clustered-asparagine-rich protein [Plasmodium brasilianum]|uniref:Clustered-asparagine-rich protein, putative n=2 Tax=Plasmodium (Plasmodium) TaxID=418103 RepID=A0A1A8WZU4_PLAMA|nr:clustered-asparagine-rich protein, putative [Plasmodium malariae]KAI4835067.1 clustered-asparagine-rich protein [Plasmodium brasilianum]SBS96935.1 clustered-asparagine-rich protein, putative [Plasmodium malariae]SCP03643.1 clustered-asparagine-rich protein, putative [Plasmodium malariae]
MSSEILNSTIDGILNTRIHIQNIPPHVTDAHLRSVLGNVGQIKDICYFNKNKKQMNNNFANKKVYNTALITFNTHEEALNVLKNIKSLIDTSGEEKSIEAKFAVPNVNNNFFNKNNMNTSFINNNNNNNNLNNFPNGFNNNENFGNNNNNNMNNFNFYSNNNNLQNNFMNKNVKNKNTNNMMNMNNMNNTNQMNNLMLNQNTNFMHNNNNFTNSKILNEMLRSDGEISPNSTSGNNNNINNSNNSGAMFRKNNTQIPINNNINMYQSNDNSLDENNENTEGLSLWEIYKDKNNNTFYYNNLTKHSQWNKPIHPNKLFQYNNNEKTKQNGPNGSNLFIFHIPSEWSDLDLFQHFCCFGNIISSKIQRDNTGRNSGFGFVSYDNIMSAHHAIQFMNGYFVNNKYLKVQLKKGEATEKAQA